MSLQTKKQFIGYILKSFLDVGFSKQVLVDVSNDLHINLNHLEDHQYYNHDGYTIIEHVCKSLKIESEMEKDLKSALYWLHDEKTIEQAGEFYTAFELLYIITPNHKKLDMIEIQKRIKVTETPDYNIIEE